MGYAGKCGSQHVHQSLRYGLVEADDAFLDSAGQRDRDQLPSMRRSRQAEGIAVKVKGKGGDAGT